jgi:Domain of unknown function (DUF4037)
VPSPRPTGLQLAADLYHHHVRELVETVVPGPEHAALLAGPGSEVLGFDTATSQDHDWGPRLQVLVPAGSVDEVDAVLAQRLPRTLHGFPVRFGTTYDATMRHRVQVTTLSAWSVERLGVDATDDRHALTTEQWLSVPWQCLAETVGGDIFHDGPGDLTAMRARLAWYPDDVARWVLACQWHRIAQEQGFVGRTASVGDDLGSTVVAARLVRDAMHLRLLYERRWPTYSKWLGTTVSRVGARSELTEPALRAVRASGHDERERALGEVMAGLARRHNDSRLTAPLDPGLRPFFDRPYLVIGAERFVQALLATVQDRDLAARPLTGSVSQWVDSTDVLRRPGSAALS